jgi:hypothetical protein
MRERHFQNGPSGQNPSTLQEKLHSVSVRMTSNDFKNV